MKKKLYPNIKDKKQLSKLIFFFWRTFYELLTWDFGLQYYSNKEHDNVIRVIKHLIKKANKEIELEEQLKDKLYIDGFIITNTEYLTATIYLNLDNWKNLNTVERKEVLGHEFFHCLQDFYSYEQLCCWVVRKFMVMQGDYS